MCHPKHSSLYHTWTNQLRSHVSSLWRTQNSTDTSSFAIDDRWECNASSGRSTLSNKNGSCSYLVNRSHGDDITLPPSAGLEENNINAQTPGEPSRITTSSIAADHRMLCKSILFYIYSMIARIKYINHLIAWSRTEPGRHCAAPTRGSKGKDTTPKHKHEERLQGDATRGLFNP